MPTAHDHFSGIDFRLAIEHAPIHIIYTDPDGTIRYANPAVQDITGYRHDEIIGNNPRLWGRQMGRDFYAYLWHTIKQRRETFRGEIINRRKNGQSYVADVRIAPIVDAKNRLQGFVGIEIDITERQRAQEEVLAQNRRLLELYRALNEVRERDEALLASLGEGVLAVDREGKVILINQHAESLLRVQLRQVVGRHHGTLGILFDANDRMVPLQENPIERALKDAVKVRLERCRCLRTDGTKFPLDISASPVFSGGQTVGAVALLRKIADAADERG